MKHAIRRAAPALFAALLLAGCAALPPAAEKPVAPAAPAWAMEGGGPDQRSFAPDSPGTKWRVPEIIPFAPEHKVSPIGEYSAPLVVGDRVFVASSTGGLYALDAKKLRTLWRFETKGGVHASPAYADGLLFVGDDLGNLSAVDWEGNEAWSISYAYPLVASPVVAEGRLYIAAADQNLYCCEAATGEELWQYGHSRPERGRVWRAMTTAAAGGRLYLGTGDGELLAFDGPSGELIWRVELARRGGFPDIVAGPAVADGVVYVGSRLGGTAAFEAEDGALLWKSEVKAASGFAVGETLLYLGTDVGGIAALSRADGTLVWKAALGGEGSSTRPTLAGDLLLVGASEGALYGLDAATGEERASYRTGSGLFAQPWADGRGWIVHSNADNLHRMDRSGSWD